MTEETEGNSMTELVIEDVEACELAAELVELTGDSLRTAVVTALREERDRALARRRRHDRIMAITRDNVTFGGQTTNSTLIREVLPRVPLWARN
jgi:hypothetical protein